MAELNRCPACRGECEATCEMRADNSDFDAYVRCKHAQCRYRSPITPFSGHGGQVGAIEEAIAKHNAMPQPDREVSDEEILDEYVAVFHNHFMEHKNTDNARLAAIRAVLRLVRTAGEG